MAGNNPGRKKRPSKVNYNSTQRWLANKAARIARHKKKHPNELQEVGTVPNYNPKSARGILLSKNEALRKLS